MLAGPITNLGALKTTVADWLYRAGDTNFATNAPLFIDLFERTVARKLRVQEMQVTVTAVVPSPPVIPVPADYLEMVRLQLTGLPGGMPNQPLTYVTPQRAAFLDASTAPSGTPQWYTIINNSFVINPQQWVPAGASYELIYYGFTQLAVAGSGVNWLLTEHPDIYLFGSLMMGAAYVDDKETVAFWKSASDDAMDQLVESNKKKTVGKPLVMMPTMQFRTQRRRAPWSGA